jgi:purine-nucleoside phosphorylase
MPKCTVKGHSGNFILGTISGKKIIIMQGRFHLYEGKTVHEVTLPILIMHMLGINKLILTNSAGGINYNYDIGDIMIIEDHINLSGVNPLIGIKATTELPIFIDMGNCYNNDLKKIAKEICDINNITQFNGVYLQLSGPSYETYAEIKAFRIMGADAVGMSTAVECIFARYLGLKVLGISSITNKAAGMLNEKLDHKDVLSVTNKNSNNYKTLIYGIINRL